MIIAGVRAGRGRQQRADREQQHSPGDIHMALASDEPLPEPQPHKVGMHMHQNNITKRQVQERVSWFTLVAPEDG